MRRALLVALALHSAAAAQSVDDWIEQAIDPRTAPGERAEVLKRVEKTKEGLDKLAARGLNPAAPAEPVHAAVETLLRAQDYRPYLEPVCRLLLEDRHRENVLRRIQAVGDSDRWKDLLNGCAEIARNSVDPERRRAALIALSVIPRRGAIDVIVDVGLASADEQVRKVASDYVQRLFGRTLKEAAAYLQTHKLDTYNDFQNRRIDELLAEKAEYAARIREWLAEAPAPRAFLELEKGGQFRVFAAERVRSIAKENGNGEPTEFARRVFDAVAAELDRAPADPAVLEALVDTLTLFARDATGPLLQVRKPREVRDKLVRVATVAGGGEKLGQAAVGLLGVVDDEGTALVEFAEKYPVVDVRKQAIQQLGQLARASEKASGWIGLKLAELLARFTAEPALRGQILSLLTERYVPLSDKPFDVVGAASAYLEQGATPELSDAELRDCAMILGRKRTDDVKKLLTRVASTHAKVQVRKYAVEEALLPWARTDETIHADLKALVLAPAAEQPVEARKVVIEALGRKGGRRSAQTLKELEESKELLPELLPFVREAKLQLLRRLLTERDAATGDAPEERAKDLEAAAALLEQAMARAEQENATADVERLEKLADQVVRAADTAKRPAGTARYRLAWISQRLPPDKVKEEDILRRYDEAATKAVADSLPAALREGMLNEYRKLLTQGSPKPGQLEKAAACAKDLGQVAEGQKDPQKAAMYYLDGVEYALRVPMKELCEALLQQASATGGIAGELVQREKQLRTAVEQLPG
jgi:hypothetical protein